MNRIRYLGIIAAAVVMSLCLQLTVFAQGEKKISPKKLPSVVLNAFQKSYPSAKIKGASTEVENGKTIYEVESVDGKIGRDLLYAEDGKVLEIEETVPVKDLPDGVAKAVKKELPSGKIQKSEKLTKGETVQFEFVVLVEKEKHEVVVDPSGKIVKNSKMKATEKEEEKEK
jgi:hypothetical protein